MQSLIFIDKRPDSVMQSSVSVVKSDCCATRSWDSVDKQYHFAIQNRVFAYESKDFAVKSKISVVQEKNFERQNKVSVTHVRDFEVQRQGKFGDSTVKHALDTKNNSYGFNNTRE
jgi:hypothetical protein